MFGLGLLDPSVDVFTQPGSRGVAGGDHLGSLFSEIGKREVATIAFTDDDKASGL